MKMNKKDMFIAMVERLVKLGEATNMFADGEYTDAMAYFEAFKSSVDSKSDKPKFTDNGKLILQYMRDNAEASQNMFKAREIAEGIFISSKSVSGSMRKLVNDGFVEKIGQDPIIYAITEAGMQVEID